MCLSGYESAGIGGETGGRDGDRQLDICRG